MKAGDITFTDYSKEILDEMLDAVFRALTRCGLQAEGYAKDLCPVDTGNLRNSITNTVDMDEKAVYVGSNLEYAPYIELGTGIYYSGGRETPWVYQDEKGEWHTTRGAQALPFLKPAIVDHRQTYKNIFDDEFRNG